MFSICPRCSLSCANAARHTLNVPFKSISTTVPNPFGDNSSALHRKFPAAPFTTISIRPNASTVFAIALSTCAGSRTSATTGIASPPFSLMYCAAGSRCSNLRLTSATRAPASANARATPPVIPVPPPVTNATRPRKTPSAKIFSLNSPLMGLLSDPQRFFEFEFSFVQGFANNNTVEQRFAHRAQPFDIVETRHTTRSRDVNIRRAHDRERLFHVWSSQHAVTRYVGVNDPLDAATRNHASEFDRRHVRGCFPTARHHVTVARVDAHADLRRKAVHKLAQMSGRLGGDSTQHHAGNAELA